MKSIENKGKRSLRFEKRRLIGKADRQNVRKQQEGYGRI